MPKYVRNVFVHAYITNAVMATNHSNTYVLKVIALTHTHTHNQKLVITQLIYLPRLLVLIKRVSVF